jgi:hypothetical protein
MKEVEDSFVLFLKDWRAFPEAGTEQAVDSKPVIVERRLAVAPHNSWRTLGNGGSPCFVSLNKEEGPSGAYHSSGALKIINYPLHPLISLVFKLEYRGTLH